MSCISKILEMKGDKPFLKFGEMTAVEGGGEYRGYEYIVTFYRSHRCGYVALPSSHPLYDEYYMDIDIEVHGGLTFGSTDKPLTGFESDCSDKWIGFDAIHCYDQEDFDSSDRYGIPVSEYSRKNPNTFGKIRSFEYMESECKRLIDQLVEYDND